MLCAFPQVAVLTSHQGKSQTKPLNDFFTVGQLKKVKDVSLVYVGIYSLIKNTLLNLFCQVQS